MRPIKMIFEFFSLKARNAKKRRANYEFLKAEITKKHLSGKGALSINFKGKRFDDVDLSAFRPPMYRVCRNQNLEPMIVWDGKMMTEEIGYQPTEVTNGSKESSSETVS